MLDLKGGCSKETLIHRRLDAFFPDGAQNSTLQHRKSSTNSTRPPIKIRFGGASTSLELWEGVLYINSGINCGKFLFGVVLRPASAYVGPHRSAPVTVDLRAVRLNFSVIVRS